MRPAASESEPARRFAPAAAAAAVLASIRSRTASARRRSILPERKARSVNSPGRASRAPHAPAARTSRSTTAGLPCTEISPTSSPVNEAGEAKYVTSAVSIGEPAPSTRGSRYARRGVGTAGRRGARAARMRSASGPESRTSAIAERPAGVAGATMVSSNASEGRIRD